MNLSPANLLFAKWLFPNLRIKLDTTWTFEGGRAEANETENRLQLFFDEKPAAEQRQALKQNGFVWAPSQGAWQRQLTKNAIYSAGRIEFIQPQDGNTPCQIQPFSRKTEPDRSDR